MPLKSITFTQADFNNIAGTADGTYDYTANGNIPTSNLVLQYSTNGTDWIDLSTTNVDTSSGGGTGAYVAWTFVSLPEGTYSFRVLGQGLNPAGNAEGKPVLSNEADNVFVPCFLMGTLIRTVGGEVPVEMLRAGDLVVTAAGGAETILWIGHRTMDASNPRNYPIRLRSGCFGGGLPARDLYLSPEHGVFVDGVLVPAWALANGGSIAPAARDEITYFHIVLARHDVILAEGLPAESYLNDDDIGLFDNGDEAPFTLPGMVPCAPRVVQGGRLDAIRMRLGDCEAVQAALA